MLGGGGATFEQKATSSADVQPAFERATPFCSMQVSQLAHGKLAQCDSASPQLTCSAAGQPASGGGGGVDPHVGAAALECSHAAMPLAVAGRTTAAAAQAASSAAAASVSAAVRGRCFTIELRRGVLVSAAAAGSARQQARSMNSIRVEEGAQHASQGGGVR